MNKTFLRNFRRIYRPKGLLTREPGEPPETFEQLQQRALERERAELAQQAGTTDEVRAQGAAPQHAEDRSSRRDSSPNDGLAEARVLVRKAENAVSELERLLARAEADIRHWEAQGRILDRARTPRLGHKLVDRALKVGRSVLKHGATPANLESAKKRRDKHRSDLAEARQYLQRMQEQLRRLQE
jgi:hypothetical protein